MWTSWFSRHIPTWPLPNDEWVAWVARLSPKYSDRWKLEGIEDAIRMSTVHKFVDKQMLAALACFWNVGSNALILLGGPLAPTVMDVCNMLGLLPHGKIVAANMGPPNTSSVQTWDF